MLILKACTFKISCSKNRCAHKLEGKAFSCSSEQIFIEWLLYARHSVWHHIHFLSCIGEKLSQTFSSINGNCALTTPYAGDSPVYDSSSPFSLPPQNQCVWLPSSIFSGMSSRHLTLTCPLETGGRTEMTGAWGEEKWGVSVEWVQSLCLEWWESLGNGQWGWPQHCECTSYD